MSDEDFSKVEMSHEEGKAIVGLVLFCMIFVAVVALATGIV